MADTVSAELKAMLGYPTVSEATVSRWNSEDELTDEIKRLNDALDTGAEQARRLRNEANLQTARADVAEATLRAGNERVAAMERRLREGREIIKQLSAIAALSIYADAALWRQCCNSDVLGPHADDCPVRAAEEWLG